MNLDELRSVQRTERQKDSLQHLRDSFYRDVADYVAELKAERERAAAEADDPFSSPEVGRLTDEIETAEEVVESLYERRVGKVVKRATFAAADMAAEEEGLTSEERELFDDLVARIKENRESVLDTLAGTYDDGDASATDAEGASADATPAVIDDAPSTPPTESGASPTSDTPTESGASPTSDTPTEGHADDGLLADAMGGNAESAAANADGAPESTDARSDGSDDADATLDVDATTDGGTAADFVPTDDAASASATDATSESTSDAGPAAEHASESDAASAADRTTVRITRDVGEIFGVDEREYDLAREDVVTLPTTNAEPLIDREAAEPLE
ncbi:MAG: hypothetical protein ABEJ78_02070 [Haloferacaceae archaeon]